VDVNTTNGITKHHPTEADARGLETNIDEIRDHLGALVSELDRRRRDAMDLKLQFHRRPVTLVLVAVAAVGMLAGAIALVVTQWHRRRSLVGRADRMRAALRRVARRPELLAEHEPTVGHKIAAAGGSTLASVLAKQLARRLVSA
jgi:hypothetical protein